MFLPALPVLNAKKESTDLIRCPFLFCCSRILLQPDDSLQILAPVEADVGFYTCNATNALGYDSVSIAVTLAGNMKILCGLFRNDTVGAYDVPGRPGST